MYKQTTTTTDRPKARNCKEVIEGKLQVQWEIYKDSAIIELYGRISENQYMAFGLSGGKNYYCVRLCKVSFKQRHCYVHDN